MKVHETDNSISASDNAKCNKVICIYGIYECCRDCLLIIKIDICNKVDEARFKCLTIYECWRDYMNEDSGVMIVL